LELESTTQEEFSKGNPPSQLGWFANLDLTRVGFLGLETINHFIPDRKGGKPESSKLTRTRTLSTCY